ncbi:quinon protein alcohol dehydrogenase-like superfamily [Cercophora scortea]|uniref:Quinon protein alcohol dehydrogenase-like superfamily n=1 Tax=Cercophora scortea TaxID=314031 RepID=A0AAE0IGP0_9PEZI|nr:quinon protein alcohol dehydrogenase-like superfamily [Cercophora scortea]
MMQPSNTSVQPLILSAVVLLLTLTCNGSASSASGPPRLAESAWTGWGGNALNNRWASTNHFIGSKNIASASLHCKLDFPFGVSATPATVSSTSMTYFPTWNGSYIALDYKSCRIKWAINVTRIVHDFAVPSPEQTIMLHPASRTSAEIDLDNNVLYFGTQTHALIVAADLSTGKILAVKQLHTHPLAVLTTSGTRVGDTIYTGVSSMEETAGWILPLSNRPYACCSFIGAALAVRFTRETSTFSILWTVPTIPKSRTTTDTTNSNPTDRWTGAGIWGSQPPIDHTHEQVFFATGNLYTVPTAYLPCTVASLNQTAEENTCLPPDIWQETVLAINMRSGRVNWARRLYRLDAYVGLCDAVPPNTTACPQANAVDYDFGMAPTLIPPLGLLVVGQKSGVLFGLDAVTGTTRWSTSVGPGTAAGGLSWGMAADHTHVYFTSINLFNAPYTPPIPNAAVISSAAYGAASLADGHVVWERAVRPGMASRCFPTIVGDVILTGRHNRNMTAEPDYDANDPAGLVALGRRTGRELLDFKLGTFFQGGISVAGRYVFFGTGYKVRGTGFQTYNGSFYVLSVDG